MVPSQILSCHRDYLKQELMQGRGYRAEVDSTSMEIFKIESCG